MVTSGGTEALASALFGLIEPGDEVVLIEPLYDSYLPIVRRAGATAKLVRLEPPGWALPLDALEAAFSERTKLILVNTPMNPCAKVFRRAELEAMTGQSSLPHVFIGGEHVGGLATGPGIATLDEDGELDGLLASAGATQSAGGTGGGKLFGIF